MISVTVLIMFDSFVNFVNATIIMYFIFDNKLVIVLLHTHPLRLMKIVEKE